MVSVGGMPILDVGWGYECYCKAKEKGIGTTLNLWENRIFINKGGGWYESKNYGEILFLQGGYWTLAAVAMAFTTPLLEAKGFPEQKSEF